jgi:hypothetical protein
MPSGEATSVDAAPNPVSPDPSASDSVNAATPPAAPDLLASAPPSTDAQPTGEVELPPGDEDGAGENGLAGETAPVSTPPTSTSDIGLIPSPIAPAGSAEVATADEAQDAPSKAELDARQAEIDALDKLLADEMAKPILNRDLAPLLPRYRELAERSGDEYTQAYARVRIQQIEAAQEMIEGVKTIGRLKDEAHVVRQTSSTERSKIRYMPVRTDGGFDIEGELRTSALYESPIGPKRYRIVNTKVSPARTIGYVEVPADPPVDLSGYLGRRVGVRARERMLQSGDVDPLSIYVASEIVALSPAPDGSSQTMVSIMIPAAGSGSSSAGSPTASVP